MVEGEFWQVRLPLSPWSAGPEAAGDSGVALVPAAVGVWAGPGARRAARAAAGSPATAGSQCCATGSCSFLGTAMSVKAPSVGFLQSTLVPALSGICSVAPSGQ